jgi:glycosyltransferase involved in cell wall biosynthesis
VHASSTSMNVLHILVGLPRGGKERLVLDVCRKGPGIGVTGFILAMNDGALKEEFLRSEIDLRFSERSLPIDWRFVRDIRRSVKELQIDVVHTHEPVEAMHAFFATLNSRVPHVLSLHGFCTDLKNRLALRFLRSRVETLILVSESYRVLEPLIRRQSRGTHQAVLHNGIDLKRFEGARGVLRAELGVGSDSPLVGTIAHFVPGKDPLTIARALGIIMSDLPELHFVFVGTRDPRTPDIYDSCRQHCETLPCSSRIHFLHSREDIPAILASLDLLVLSSTQETFGLAAAEAMCVGTPLLLSRIPAFVEVAAGDECAFYFSVGDADDLARKMHEMMRDPGGRSRKIRSAKARVQGSFTIEHHIVALREIYREAVARKQKQ